MLRWMKDINKSKAFTSHQNSAPGNEEEISVSTRVLYLEFYSKTLICFKIKFKKLKLTKGPVRSQNCFINTLHCVAAMLKALAVTSSKVGA